MLILKEGVLDDRRYRNTNWMHIIIHVYVYCRGILVQTFKGSRNRMNRLLFWKCSSLQLTHFWSIPPTKILYASHPLSSILNHLSSSFLIVMTFLLLHPNLPVVLLDLFYEVSLLSFCDDLLFFLLSSPSSTIDYLG